MHCAASGVLNRIMFETVRSFCAITLHFGQGRLAPWLMRSTVIFWPLRVAKVWIRLLASGKDPGFNNYADQTVYLPATKEQLSPVDETGSISKWYSSWNHYFITFQTQNGVDFAFFPNYKFIEYDLIKSFHCASKGKLVSKKFKGLGKIASSLIFFEHPYWWQHILNIFQIIRLISYRTYSLE